MRLLAHNKVFTIVNIDDIKEAYALAPTSKLLVKGTNHCLSSMVHLITDPNIVDLYYQLSEWTSNERLTIHETTFWDYYHQNPNHLKSFNDAMESDSHMVRLAINDCKFVFDGLTSLVDVGGGTGNTAKIISEAFPTLKCIVFDLPNVVEGLTDNNYLSFVGGNMFESFLQADAILLKVCMQEIRSKVKKDIRSIYIFMKNLYISLYYVFDKDELLILQTDFVKLS
jgi:isoflavone-7-O-methyltransferase